MAKIYPADFVVDNEGTPVSTVEEGTRTPVVQVKGEPGPYVTRDAWGADPIDKEKNLPGNETNIASSNINWLGSSYSGADIKVVAHTYGSVEQLEDITTIQKQIEGYRAAADAVESLLLEYDGIFYGKNRGALSSEFDNWARAKAFIINQLPNAEAKQEASSHASFLATYSRDVNQPIRKGVTETRAKALRDLATAQEEAIKPVKELIENSSATQVLGTLQTLSVQSHREKYPVRALGHSYAKGYTRGPRTIAGSMILTVFHEHALKQFIRASNVLMKQYGELDYYTKSLLPDQLPPMDLTIAFVNEYGSRSRMAIYGVEFLNDGVTYSIEDLLSEQVINFVARDIDIMSSEGRTTLNKYERGMFGLSPGEVKDVTGSELAFTEKEAYDRFLMRTGARRRFKNI